MKAQVRCIKMQESDLHHRSKAFIKAGSQPASENSDHIENGSCFLLVNDAPLHFQHISIESWYVLVGSRIIRFQNQNVVRRWTTNISKDLRDMTIF